MKIEMKIISGVIMDIKLLAENIEAGKSSISKMKKGI